MSSFVRKSVVCVRRISTLKNYSLGAKQNKIPNRTSNLRATIPIKTLYGPQRNFHTTSVTNKIVAFHLSDIGEGIREVVIKEWFVKEGDKVSQFDNICEVQSDKAAVTITSRYDGIITKLHHQVDHTALVGQALVDIEMEDDASSKDVTTETKSADKKQDEENILQQGQYENTHTRTGKVLTTPSVRRIASQFQVNLTDVKATGKHGRIMKEDILRHLNITSDLSNEIPQTSTIPSEDTKQINIVQDKTVPVTGFTKAMVKSMTEAMKIPHFVLSDEYDVTKLVQARKELKALAEKYGVKVTYMPIIIKAASLCLSTYPVLNSSLDEKCENIIYKASHNIGVAMDTPNGLVVPVIRNAEQKTILEIAKELNNLQEKGSRGQLGLSDLSGGTFTLSNIGIIGGTYTKPVIFPPQVSIGALGKIQVLPRFDASGNVIKSHILPVSWSADHRIIDGVTMAKFSRSLQDYLEEPYKLLLDL